MILHTDQRTLDQWRESGRFVLFGEGEIWHYATGYDGVLDGTTTRPPAAMIEAAEPCITCGGEGKAGMFCNAYADPRMSNPCDGQRRHPVTVPCPCRCHVDAMYRLLHDDERCDCSDGRISTGLLAVVEWGPLRVYDTGPMTDEEMDALDEAGDWIERDGDHLLWWHEDRKIDGTYCTRLTPPPGVDPQSLVGQFAIGGRIEVTTP